MEDSLAMGVQSTPKRHAPIFGFGPETIQIIGGDSDQKVDLLFSNEDLLCVRSGYFSNLFDNKKTGSYCAFCEGTFRHLEQVEYCAKCEVFLHQQCRTRTSRLKMRPQCPDCRETCVPLFSGIPTMNCSRLEQNALNSYVRWLSGTYYWTASSNDEDMITKAVIDTYLLGEIVRDATFQEMFLAIIDEYSKTTISWASSLTINHVYTRTTEGSRLRELIVDLFISRGDETWLDDDTYPLEFVNQLAQTFLARRQTIEGEFALLPPS